MKNPVLNNNRIISIQGTFFWDTLKLFKTSFIKLLNHHTKQKSYQNIPLRKRDLHSKNRNIFQQFLIERRVENKYLE